MMHVLYARDQHDHDRELVLEHLTLETQPFADPVADQDAVIGREDPEIEHALSSLGVEREHLGSEQDDLVSERMMQPAADTDLAHNTPFTAVIEDGDAIPGREYLERCDDGALRLLTVDQVYSIVDHGHLIRHVEGTVQPLGS